MALAALEAAVSATSSDQNGRRLITSETLIEALGRAQFAYDFFQFANAQPITYKGMKIFGHGATKSQAESVEKSIWIVEGNSPHVGRYIADVVFDREN